MFLPSTRPYSVRVNRWNREAPASWSSVSCLPPGRLLERFWGWGTPEILQHTVGNLKQGRVRFGRTAGIGRLRLVGSMVASWPFASTISGEGIINRAESGADTFEDQPQIMGSQLKRSSG